MSMAIHQFSGLTPCQANSSSLQAGVLLGFRQGLLSLKNAVAGELAATKLTAVYCKNWRRDLFGQVITVYMKAVACLPRQ